MDFLCLPFPGEGKDKCLRTGFSGNVHMYVEELSNSRQPIVVSLSSRSKEKCGHSFGFVPRTHFLCPHWSGPRPPQPSQGQTPPPALLTFLPPLPSLSLLKSRDRFLAQWVNTVKKTIITNSTVVLAVWDTPVAFHSLHNTYCTDSNSNSSTDARVATEGA